MSSDSTQIRPPSPATLSREFQEYRGPENVEKSDKLTASINLEELKREACMLTGKEVTGVFKIGEGGFNQVLVLVLDDGSDIVARLNCSSGNVEDAHLTEEILSNRVASEVATLKYLKEKTTIPVPTVYGFCCSTNNPVGARYIFMERLIGQHAFGLGGKLSDDQQLKFFTQLFEYESQLFQTGYSLTGSLLENKHGSGYVVGPLGHPMLPHNVTTFTEGPWETTEDLLKAFARMRRDFIVENTHLWKEWRHHYRLVNGDLDGDPPLAFFQTFYTLLAEAIGKLKFPEEASSVLYNPDFTDVLVSYEDPSRIVGIVDWEGTCFFPMWYGGALLNHKIVYDCFRDESMREKWSKFRYDMLKAHGIPLIPVDALEAGETWRVRRHLMWFFQMYFLNTASPQRVADEFMEIWNSWEATTQALFEPVVYYLKQLPCL